MTKTVELVQLAPETLRALADGDLEAARQFSGLAFNDHFAGLDWRSTWQRRAAQVVDDPSSAPWITRAIRDADSGAVVGRAGFHGPPDQDGMVEVGYAVDPQFRHRGYARAALLAMLRWAAREASVSRVRASIRPDNLTSLSLVKSLGFVAVGDQWDDEDGLEIVYEICAEPAPGEPAP